MMKKYLISFVVAVILVLPIYGQSETADSLKTVQLKEVIVVGNDGINHKKEGKPLASIDAYLEKSSRVTMIKRGNYAWEPSINNMVSDRISVTIDGMQIFGACTDKMDPITSYVDISNLSEVHISSGQQGAENGATIGGGIDLKLQKGNFNQDRLSLGIDTGFETNGNAKIISLEFNYSDNRFFINSDYMYRKSDNYSAGGNQEILYSQYKKMNFSTILGTKISKNASLIGTLIYDKATDIGYPALPMDVSLAKAVITSLSYEQKDLSETISDLEMKFYYNSVEHVMDDTKRPNVAIHMDMPGWSDTYGFYSKMVANPLNHKLQINLNSYINTSKAEMTMYPNDPNESLMYMLTWPDVKTWYSGVFVQDELNLNTNFKMKVSGRLGYQSEEVQDALGFNSLKIFYPEMEQSQDRLLKSFSSQIDFKKESMNYSFGLGYGERGPSITEGYGFYLFNSFDNFDYVGNTFLNNEKSLEINTAVNYSKEKVSIGLEASYFHISDYIIGEIDEQLSAMTIGATGVKIYKGLKYATLFNTSLDGTYNISPRTQIQGRIAYSLGKDYLNENLPLISPLNYGMNFLFQIERFNSEIALRGAGNQRNYRAVYGEDLTEGYAVIDLSTSRSFYIGNQSLLVKLGIENVFDTYYSTYADWNNIPRMGRNTFLNLSYIIK